MYLEVMVGSKKNITFITGNTFHSIMDINVVQLKTVFTL